ncbi:MFS general substrate transporter [Gonapodya prolifera JEL478]|uniref:MFS general substrate transporter n=1 Tax=Gonapodya prolifera (strain JEL478) TaxID=1344416 RepID=A0A139A317_GONPJ|nr:MFS general substrate transporter [Gonapodya prolifera JEL478]|eukprot:KXS11150.1 MFS general substrate transporter [Gonapodya prolifera JEL478]
MADSIDGTQDRRSMTESTINGDVQSPLKAEETPAKIATDRQRPGNGLVYSRFQFTMMFVGLASSVFLTTLDQTIVAVANPSIVTDFQTFSGLSWIGTAFFLGSIPLIPTYGKLADVFGRKPVFMAGILIFEIGSLICGVAQNMSTLIVGRAVAGLGSGCIFPMTIVIISDIVPIENRSRYQGIIGACFGLSSVVGPLMGGAFTDHLSWRWCFYINFPIGGFAMLAVLLFLRLPAITGNVKEKLARVDYIGTFWLASGTVLLVYALSAGGVDYDWNSAPIIFMIVISVACFVTFGLVEVYVVKTPLIPFELYKNRFVLATWCCAFLFGFCFYSLSYYVPLYFQVVNGNSATEAGIHTIPLILAVTIFSLTSGFLISATGWTAPFVHFGSACTAIGVGLTSTLNPSSSVDKQIGYLFLTGMGLGSSHNASLPLPLKAGWSFSQLAGGVFGFAVNGTIFSSSLTTKLSAFIASPQLIEFVQNNPSKLKDAALSGLVPTSLLEPIRGSYTDSLALVFRAMTVAASSLFLASFLLRRQRLQRKKVVKADKGAGAA